MVDDDKLVTRSFANSFSDAFDLIQVNSPDLAMQVRLASTLGPVRQFDLAHPLDERVL
jgi:hypothetical protein